MILTFYQMVSEFYKYIRESRTTSPTDETAAKTLVNKKYQELLSWRGWHFTQQEIELSFPYTQLNGDHSAGATSLTVDSNSGFEVGQTIILYGSESEFEECEISGLTSTTGVTLSAATDNAYDDDDYVVGVNLWLPHYVRTVLNVRTKDDPSDNYDAMKLKYYSPKDIAKKHPLWKVDKQPLEYTIGRDGTSTTKYPSTGTYTASAGDGDSITCATPAMPDNYFDNWLLIDQTQNKAARVSSYASNVFSLEEDISAADSDVFTLRRQLIDVSLYPAPKFGVDIILKVIRGYPPLINDYDVPVIPDEYHHLPALAAAVEELAKDESRLMLYQIHKAELDQAKREMRRKIKPQRDKKPRIQPARGFCV